jgi:hypothetical protein
VDRYPLRSAVIPEIKELQRLLGKKTMENEILREAVERGRSKNLIASWLEQRVPGTAILAALRREHGYTGSYSSLYRMIVSINAGRAPDATAPLDFAPGDAAQVDFGAGPMLPDADGVLTRTWGFVMTLAFSRHQYVEFARPTPRSASTTTTGWSPLMYGATAPASA